MKRIILFLLVIFPLTLLAQDSIYTQIAKYPDNEKISFILQLVDIYKDIDLEKSLEYANYAKGLAISQKDTLSTAKIYLLIGTIYNKIGNYEFALDNSLKALKQYELTDNKAGIAHSLNAIGIVYIQLNNNESLPTFERALTIFKDIKNENGVIKVLNSIGSIYFHKTNYSEALKYYLEAYELSKTHNQTELLAITLNNLGLVHKTMNDYERALDYYHQSLTIKEIAEDKHGIVTSLLNIGNLYRLKKQYNLAEESYDKALGIANSIKASDLTRLCYQGKYLCREGKLDYKNALLFYRRASEIRDSIFDQDRNKKITEMQVKFETEEKEREIQLLNQQNRIKDLQLNRQNILFVLFFLTFSLLIAIVYLERKRLKLRNTLSEELSVRNQTLEMINEKLLKSENNLKEINSSKDRLFSIIAHDLKNPFFALKGTLELLSTNFDDFNESKKRDFIRTINNSVNRIMYLLENLLNWSRSQSGKIEINNEYFKLADIIIPIVNLYQHAANTKEISINFLISPEMDVNSDKQILSSIIRNLFNNAIKYTTKNGTITLEAEERNGNILIKVIDSGVGIPEERIEHLFDINVNLSTKGTAREAGSGLGLVLCGELIDKLNGKISVESSVNNGSTFTISIPRNL